MSEEFTYTRKNVLQACFAVLSKCGVPRKQCHQMKECGVGLPEFIKLTAEAAWIEDFDCDGTLFEEAQMVRKAARNLRDKGEFKFGTEEASYIREKQTVKHSVTRDELAEILSSHRCEIVEADEWRPLATHVIQLVGKKLKISV